MLKVPDHNSAAFCVALAGDFAQSKFKLATSKTAVNADEIRILYGEPQPEGRGRTDGHYIG